MSSSTSIPGSTVWDTPERPEFKNTLSSHSLKIRFTSDISTRSSTFNLVMYISPKSGLMAKIVHVLNAYRNTLWASLEVTQILALIQKDGLWYNVPFSHPPLRVCQTARRLIFWACSGSQKDHDGDLGPPVLRPLCTVGPLCAKWFPTLPPRGCRDGMQPYCVPRLPIKNCVGSGVWAKPSVPDT